MIDLQIRETVDFYYSHTTFMKVDDTTRTTQSRIKNKNQKPEDPLVNIQLLDITNHLHNCVKTNV